MSHSYKTSWLHPTTLGASLGGQALAVPAITTAPYPPMPKISAISIYVHDIKQAEAFYRDMLGFTVAGRPAPFLVELEHDGIPLVLCAAERPTSAQYSKDSATVLGIATDDVVKQASALRAKGATVLFDEPQEFPVGQFNAVRDPSGNVVELLEFRA